MTALSPFTTYFGTPIQGFYITWSGPNNTSEDLTQSELIATCSWQLYNVEASTGDGEILDAATASYDITFYMAWLIGDTIDAAKAFDVVLGTLEATVTDGGASADSMVVDWKSSSEVVDRYCTDELCAVGADDSTSNQWDFTAYSGSAAEKMCSEFWVTSDFDFVCVKIDFEIKRPFTLASADDEDIDISLRPYRLNVGW